RCDQSASAYKALGKLTLALGVADLRKEVVALVDVVLIGLEAEQGPAPKPPRRGTRDSDRDRDKEKGKGKVSCCPAAMECLANITQALGELLAPFMPKLLGPLFSNGLSERMIATLKVLSETLPSHTTQVQERLLHEISMILCGQPHNPPGSVPPWKLPGGRAAFRARRGAPKPLVGVGGPSVPVAKLSVDTSKFRPEDDDVKRLQEEESLRVLALHTLGAFKLDAFVLLPFVRDILLQLFKDPSVKVRKQAVLTACQVLVQPGKPQFLRGPSAQ
ncbi:unnamed protein product, partial [Ectocarpus sp. 13 AM-2016]